MSNWSWKTSTEYKNCSKKSGSSVPPTARKLCGFDGNGAMITRGEAMTMILECPDQTVGGKPPTQKKLYGQRPMPSALFVGEE